MVGEGQELRSIVLRIGQRKSTQSSLYRVNTLTYLPDKRLEVEVEFEFHLDFEKCIRALVFALEIDQNTLNGFSSGFFRRALPKEKWKWKGDSNDANIQSLTNNQAPIPLSLTVTATTSST